MIRFQSAYWLVMWKWLFVNIMMISRKECHFVVKTVINIEFHTYFITIIIQVLQRIDDVSLMCEKRVVCLKKLALKPKRPVQQVIPEPGVPLQPSGVAPGGAPHPLRMRKSQQLRVSALQFTFHLIHANFDRLKSNVQDWTIEWSLAKRNR